MNIYAPTIEARRRSLWEELTSFRATLPNIPWILVGGFNCTLRPLDKKGVNEIFSRDMGKFNIFLLGNHLMEVDMKNGKFTWINRRLRDNLIQFRLDRFFLSQEVVGLFGAAMGISFPRTSSDHNPIMLEMGEKIVVFGSPFHFENMWMSHESLEDLIQRWWADPLSGLKLSQCAKKLKFLKGKLKTWNKEVFGNIFTKNETFRRIC